jgi:hypothetical protein
MKPLSIVAGSIVTIVLLVSSGRAEHVGINQTWVAVTRPLAYRIEGGSNEFRASGEICNLMQSFVVESGGVKIKFTPKSKSQGRYDYSGKIDGVEVDGRGTYVVEYKDLIAIGIVATSSGEPEKTEFFYRLKHAPGACLE